MSMDVKRGLFYFFLIYSTGAAQGHNKKEGKKRLASRLLPALTYGSENWTWNGAQQLRVRAVEMSYLRGACGVSRIDGLSNECV